MLKVIWFLKRKEGITPEYFREQYEGHSRLAQKYIGDLLLEYRRNYKVETWGGGSTTAKSGENLAGGGFGPIDYEYDCLAEWVLEDEAALEKINLIFADPEIGGVFYEDEEKFLDRDAILMFKCDVADTGAGDGSGRPVRLRDPAQSSAS